MSQEQPPTSEVELTIRVGDGSETAIEFPAEAVTASCPVTKLGERLFRLEGVPLFTESAGYQDVIEADEVAEGRIRFLRVAERSGWRTYDFIVPAHWIDSEWGRALLHELDARGGHWERVFGGLLFVCVPPGSDLDPTPWVLA